MKKFLSIIIGLLLVTSNLQMAFAEGNDSGELKLNNQVRSLEIADQIECTIYGNDELENSYAGVYLDENGNLVVNYVGTTTSFKSQVATDATGTTYKNVSNNLKTLNEANQKYQDLLGQNGIQSVELSIKSNRVIVTYAGESAINYLDMLSDGNAVEFREANPEMVTQFTADVINGNAVGSKGGSSGKAATIGCRAKQSSTNKVGVLVPGHLSLPTNTNMYYNGGTTIFGTTKNSQCSGKVDATFVQTSSSYTPTLKFADGDSYEYTSVDTGIYGLREGLTVSAHGMKSGKTYGVVLSTDYSEVVGGTSMKNMVKCDYVAIHGDSGAAITYNRYIGSASSKVSVMGLQSFSSLYNDKWVPGSSFACFSRIDYIFSALGLVDY